jgi:hypothetical protein
VEAKVDVNSAVKDIWKEAGKVSGSFTVFFQNNCSSPLRFSVLPKKNEFEYKGGKFEVKGNLEKMSENVADVQPGQTSFYAFSTSSGILKAEVRQIIGIEFDVYIPPEEREEVKTGFFDGYGASDEAALQVFKENFPNLDKGFILSSALLEIYNETRRDKRQASLYEYGASLKTLEDGVGGLAAEDSPYLLNKPQCSNLPLFGLKANSFFKDADNTVLVLNFSDGVELKHSAAVMSLFNAIDKDHSGEVSKNEFVDYCRSKSPKTDPAYLDEMFKRLDEDGSGIVTLGEFTEKFQEVQKFINELGLKFENKTNRLGQHRKGGSNLFASQ